MLIQDCDSLCIRNKSTLKESFRGYAVLKDLLEATIPMHLGKEKM